MKNNIKPDLLNWENTKIKGFSSKQLIEMKNGGLKLIKVEPDSSYPLHNHPDKTEYIYVLEGVPEIIIGEDHYTGKKGEFFILNESVKHSIKNNDSNDCILLIGAIQR
jgi:quercetin dioxygenase-like cupin family protein